MCVYCMSLYLIKVVKITITDIYFYRNSKKKFEEVTYLSIIFWTQVLDSEKLRLCVSSLTS